MNRNGEQEFWERVGGVIGQRLYSWRGLERASFETTKDLTIQVAETLLNQRDEIRRLQDFIRDRAKPLA